MARTWPVLLLILAVAALVLVLPRQTARAQMLAFASPMDAASQGRVRRVQSDLARHVESWQGARDCHAPARARAALKPVLARWLGGRMTDRPTERLARWGYHSGDIWHEAQVIGGQPQCRAGFRRVIAFADFR
ncbi:MAG: hypothetical protein Q27BB25_14580 [Blastomonas sp. CACIA14H2]|jgi:hypothetical protein|uniref:hypothetical protein n=1 Tax=Blastomonas sp. CACIA14H2 TaxID=1419876 RepID=UPI0003CFA132|nr:MAG: hypothetical protein Q27BB25_14580 [Blastomonas sp. CACIA14H2]